MSIWVRRQNRGALINADYFFIDTGNRVYGDAAGNSDPNGYSFFVGKYDSEEEALAVLDMIEEEIDHQERVRLFPNETWEIPRIVFQMPEAGFLGGAAIDPKEVLALFEEPEKNQGTILNLAYTALPDLAREVIRLRGISQAKEGRP